MSHIIVTKIFRVTNSSTTEKVNDSPSGQNNFLSFDLTNNITEFSSSISLKFDLINIIF